MIDIFTHIKPVKYWNKVKQRVDSVTLEKTSATAIKAFETTRTLWDLAERFRIMDKYEGLLQVLTPSVPPVELIAPPDKATELAKVYNDEMAELVAKYPDRFLAAVACIPMNNIDGALKEADRAINELGFKGISIHTPIYNNNWTMTKPIDLPEIMPIYEMMVTYDLPIWLHPFRHLSMPDYTVEARSRFSLFHIFGWPYETSLAMARLVFSGVLNKYPSLKIITHHCAAMVPYLANRITGSCDWYEACLGAKSKKTLDRPPIDCFRQFYNDTAISGNMPALMCAYAFFGADHLLFGTDMPFDAELGNRYTRDTIESIKQMNIADSEREAIFESNARRLMNFTTSSDK